VRGYVRHLCAGKALSSVASLPVLLLGLLIVSLAEYVQTLPVCVIDDIEQFTLFNRYSLVTILHTITLSFQWLALISQTLQTQSTLSFATNNTNNQTNNMRYQTKWRERENEFKWNIKQSSRRKIDSFYQQIGLAVKEETSKVLHLKHSFIWCWNLDTSKNSSGISEKF